MITLSLLHPIKQIPVQVWTFDNESVIRIGRSTDNHVILYSAVVSRHHVELRRTVNTWELVNLGTNGTYLDGKRISQGVVSDGTVIRLARSGPNIKIRLGTEALQDLSIAVDGDRAFGTRSGASHIPTEITEHRSDLLGVDEFETSSDGSTSSMPLRGTIPVPQHLKISSP